MEARVGRSGFNDGKYKNKNLIFKIPKDFISELFVELYHKDYDKVSTLNNLFFSDLEIEEQIV